MANGLDNEGYKQLFGLIETLREEASHREERNAEWRGKVDQQLSSLPCSDRGKEIAEMKKAHEALEGKVDRAIAASRPWANLAMAALGGALVAFLTHVVKL